MAAYFTDLHEDGNKRWYNIVADRHWELQQAAKLYETPLITRGGVSHVEISVRKRAEMSYLEDVSKKTIKPHEAVHDTLRRLGDSGPVSSGSVSSGSVSSGSGAVEPTRSDYFETQRVADIERERRESSVSTRGAGTRGLRALIF